MHLIETTAFPRWLHVHSTYFGHDSRVALESILLWRAMNVYPVTMHMKPLRTHAPLEKVATTLGSFSAARHCPNQHHLVITSHQTVLQSFITIMQLTTIFAILLAAFPSSYATPVSLSYSHSNHIFNQAKLINTENQTPPRQKAMPQQPSHFQERQAHLLLSWQSLRRDWQRLLLRRRCRCQRVEHSVPDLQHDHTLDRVEVQQSGSSCSHKSFVCEIDREYGSAVSDDNCFVDFESCCCCSCCGHWWANGRGADGCWRAGVGAVEILQWPGASSSYETLCLVITD